MGQLYGLVVDGSRSASLRCTDVHSNAGTGDGRWHRRWRLPLPVRCLRSAWPTRCGPAVGRTRSRPGSIDVIAETARAIDDRPAAGSRLDTSRPRPVGRVSVSTSTASATGAATRSPRCPGAADGLITITTQTMPDGIVSGHLTRALRPGTIVSPGQPSGEFVLPDRAGPPSCSSPAAVASHRSWGCSASLADGGPLVDVVMLAPRPARRRLDLRRRAGGARRTVTTGFRSTTTYTGPGAPPPEAELHRRSARPGVPRLA